MSSKLQVYKCKRLIQAEAMTWGEWKEYRFKITGNSGGLCSGISELERPYSDDGFRLIENQAQPNEREYWMDKQQFENEYDNLNGYLTEEEHAKVHINIIHFELDTRLKKLIDDAYPVKEYIEMNPCIIAARSHFEMGFMALTRSFYQGLINSLGGFEINQTLDYYLNYQSMKMSSNSDQISEFIEWALFRIKEVLDNPKSDKKWHELAMFHFHFGFVQLKIAFKQE